MNYYKLLDIDRDANDSEIKRAYFSAVKLHSPDFDPEGFKAIRIAYETLSNHKKRAEYDAYFTAVPDDIQNELLDARELIRENKYRGAVEFLTELIGRHPDSADVKRLLAEALWLVKKSGKAEALCRELLKKEPSDYETLLLCSKIAVSRGHTTKACDYLDGAVAAAPLSPKVWIEYMRYALQHEPWMVTGIFRRAMEQSPDMFDDEYGLYLVGARDSMCNSDLFSDLDPLKYFNKFAECFINDKDPHEATYQNVMGLIPHVAEKSEIIPFVEKILPALENCKHRRDDEEEDFQFFHSLIVVNKLSSDKRIHEVLVDLTEFLLNGGIGDKDNKLWMECYIVGNLPALRPSIRVLRDEYPELFKLNQAFYIDALTEKKTEFLTDKYFAMAKRLRAAARNEPDGGGFDDEFDETEELLKPFVREAPKIGRNDPCHCGSGKKYKKCCGKGY